MQKLFYFIFNLPPQPHFTAKESEAKKGVILWSQQRKLKQGFSGSVLGWIGAQHTHTSQRPARAIHFGTTARYRILSAIPTAWKADPGSGATCGRLGGDFTRGSAPPGPVPEGLVRVYSMRFCPFAERTRLVLEAKGIRHEVININLKNKPEWFFKKNPFGLVPVLENSQGQLVYESAITCEYLDEAYPGKKLLPEDPYEKACQKMVFELFSKVPSLVGSFLRSKNKEDRAGLKEEFRKEFIKLEEVLTNKKTTFFGGNSLSMIDYLIWPWFERLEALELNECVDHAPKLKLWMAAMREDPAVSALLTDVKTFRGFLDLYLQNSLEACDYGI